MTPVGSPLAPSVKRLLCVEEVIQLLSPPANEKRSIRKRRMGQGDLLQPTSRGQRATLPAAFHLSALRNFNQAFCLKKKKKRSRGNSKRNLLLLLVH